MTAVPFATRLRGLPWRLAASIAVGVLVVGWWLGSAFAADNEVEWAEATIDDLVLGVEVEGTLSSRDASVLTPPQAAGVWDFQIRFMAPEGSEVAESDPVLGFDTSALDRSLLQLQTEAEQAAKNIEKLDVDSQQQLMTLELELAEAEAAARIAELKDDVPDDLRSSNEAEVAALDVEVAGLEVESLRDRIDAAREAAQAQRAALVAHRDRAVRLVRETEASIERMTVLAPRAGTVIYATNWRGEKSKVGDSVWRRQRIIELPDLNSMMANGEVDESDAGRVREGQPVILRLDAHPDVVYHAEIESIWRTVQRKSFSRNPLKVLRLDLALVENDPVRMRPGMRFRGTIEAERIEGALVVPARAVSPTPEGPVVYRKTALSYEQVAVELGARTADRVQVLAGLELGDRVALGSPEG